MEITPKLRFGLLHRRLDREIADLIKEAADGSVKKTLHLSKEISELVAFGLVGTLSYGKEAFEAAYFLQKTALWVWDKNFRIICRPFSLDIMESIKAVFFKPDPAAQVRQGAESEEEQH